MQTILNDQLNSCGSLWAPLYIHTSKMCRYPYTYIHLRLGLWMATSLDFGLAGWLYTVLSNDWNGKTSECRIQIWSDFNVSLELLILAERNQISWLLDWIADWLVDWLMDRLDCWLYFLHSIHTIAIMSSFVDSSVLRNLCKIMENSWEIP